MRVFYSEKHKLRNAKTELHGGLLVKPFEGPFRAEWILAAVKEAGFTDVAAPDEHGLDTALKVHDAGYLDFLKTCWERWQAAGFEGEAIPTAFAYRRSRMRVPTHIDGAVGYYMPIPSRPRFQAAPGRRRCLPWMSRCPARTG